MENMAMSMMMKMSMERMMTEMNGMKMMMTRMQGMEMNDEMGMDMKE
ncbi:hypothetical protein [Peribacillus psychrosaccharolyticus]|nr:hypothetical protein [Peribacillus psychrosaccharolyticus]